MECAGIADLTGGSNLGRAVRLAAEDVGRVAAEDRNSGLAVRVILKEILGHSRDRDRSEVEAMPASHRLEVRIDEFTNHDDLIHRVEWVNDIWIAASQCLTARVDA